MDYVNNHPNQYNKYQLSREITIVQDAFSVGGLDFLGVCDVIDEMIDDGEIKELYCPSLNDHKLIPKNFNVDVILESC